MKKILLGLALLAAGNAYAGDGGDCGGNLIDYKPIMAGSKQIGQLQLYYNNSTGKNCAIAYHGGDTWGVRSYTYVVLQTCPSAACSSARIVASEDGQFRYQAGPIRTDGAGKCVAGYGQIRYNGTDYSAITSGHCR